jgi:hypothetical protein
MAEDRQRYITMGALMLLTTIQAFYCGASLFGMAFSRPFSHVIGYGLFLAGAVFFIDRSIVSYIAPRVPGDERSKKPRHSRRAITLRFIVATAASVLLTEVILLQVFAPRINVQLAADNLSAQQAASSQISSFYQPQIKSFQDQVNAAQATVNQRQAVVDQDLQRLNCQEFGCPGIPAGEGTAYRDAENQANQAQVQLTEAQQSLHSTQAYATARIHTIEQQQEDALQQSARTTNASEDMLAREQAFWVLSVKYPEIAFARILLSLLILSIDLAPVIMKTTSSYGAYEEEIRNEILLARLRTEANAQLEEKRIQDDAEFEKQRRELDLEIALGVLHGQRRQPGSMPMDQPD